MVCRRLSLLFTASALLCLGTLAAPIPAAAAPPPPTGAINVQQAWRHALGLRADSGFVAARQHDADAAQSLANYGAVLTPAEQREMNARLAVGAAIPMLIDRLDAEAPSTFSTAYMDQAAGGVVRVGFTRLTPSLEALARIGFPDPARLAFFQAAYPATVLNPLYTAISTNMTAWRARGIDVVYAAVDARGAGVTVGVDATGGALTAAATALRAGYPHGDALRVSTRYPQRFTTACAYQSPTNCYDDPLPFKAGQEVDTTSTGETCTAGFGAYRVRTIGVPTKIYYQLTAGHCSPNGTNWIHYTYVEGSTSGEHMGGTNDSELINLSAQNEHSDLIFASAGSPPLYVKVTTAQADTADYNGETYCFYGRTTGRQRCGTIVNQNTSIKACDNTGHNCEILSQIVESSVNTMPGDSGGPNYYGTGQAGGGQMAMGITTACTADSNGNCVPSSQGFYSQIQHVTDQQGVTISTS